MTPIEIANLRLKCAEPFITTGSKVGLSDETIFIQAEKLYQFCVKDLDLSLTGKAKAPEKK